MNGSLTITVDDDGRTHCVVNFNELLEVGQKPCKDMADMQLIIAKLVEAAETTNES